MSFGPDFDWQSMRRESTSALRAQAPTFSERLDALYVIARMENPKHLRPMDIRRAILGMYMRAHGGPLTIDQVVQRLRETGLDLETTQRTSARQRVSDVMRHQVRAGRATVLGRGEFTLDVTSFRRSTQYRCLNWREVAERWARRYRW